MSVLAFEIESSKAWTRENVSGTYIMRERGMTASYSPPYKSLCSIWCAIRPMARPKVSPFCQSPTVLGVANTVPLWGAESGKKGTGFHDR